MQNRSVKVINGRNLFDRTAAKIVGGSVNDTALDASPHHPSCKGIGVMIAADSAVLMRWHAAEFRTPQD